MVSKYLFVEGAKETDNGDLRAGFQKLLSQLVKGNMPRISMGEGKSQTVDKFLNCVNKNPSLIKIDLDGPENQRQTDLAVTKLKPYERLTHYMIHEMEAWFLSQPSILDQYYGSDISSKMKNKDPKSIVHPDQELEKLAKGAGHKTRKGYHKVRDGANLLELLNAEQLMADFEDFKKLIENIKSK